MAAGAGAPGSQAQGRPLLRPVRPRLGDPRHPRCAHPRVPRADELEAAFQVFFVRRGRVLGRKGWVVDRVEELDRSQLIASFLEQLYMERQEVPARVLVAAAPADRDLLETWLAGRRGGPVRIAV